MECTLVAHFQRTQRGSDIVSSLSFLPHAAALVELGPVSCPGDKEFNVSNNDYPILTFSENKQTIIFVN